MHRSAIIIIIQQQQQQGNQQTSDSRSSHLSLRPFTQADDALADIVPATAFFFNQWEAGEEDAGKAVVPGDAFGVVRRVGNR